MTLSEYWIIHNGQTICDVSPKAAALFKAEPLELLGRNIFDIIPLSDMRELARLRMRHIVTKGDMHDQELPLQRLDGSVFWCRVQTRRIDNQTFVSTLDYIGPHSPNYQGT